MRGSRILCALTVLLAAGCFLTSCKSDLSPVSSAAPEESAPAPPVSAPEEELTEAGPEEEEAPEDSLPPPEAIVLLYTDYITVRTEQDGLEYQYTYCFDGEHNVFNAVAVLRFPSEEEAQREYLRLREQSYPNLSLEGEALSFCFPRKECPFYGISYRSLEILLAETVYEIVETHPPEGSDESTEESEES